MSKRKVAASFSLTWWRWPSRLQGLLHSCGDRLHRRPAADPLADRFWQRHRDAYPCRPWPVLLIVLLIGLAVLYRYGPDRRTARWQWVTVGSAFAAMTWIIASFLFSWYLASFANYNATYGSLGAAVGVMIWLWISNTVMLLGAELNAEIEHQTARIPPSAQRSH